MKLEGKEILPSDVIALMRRAEEAERERDSALERVADLEELLRLIQRDPVMWQVPNGPQGQDMYAGMPPMMRKIDQILKEGEV